MIVPGGHSPSPWVVRWLSAIPFGGAVLDVACGNGRHVALLRANGRRVVAVDRDTTAFTALAAAEAECGIEVVTTDLENSPWPWAGRTFAGVIATNYLWRPLLPTILRSVAVGGLLVYETFLRGQEQFGRPSNPAYLLLPGELREVVRGELEVLAFEEGPDGEPPLAMRQRICARRPGVFVPEQGAMNCRPAERQTPERR